MAEKKILLELTEAQMNQLVVSLKNDWMDNDAKAQALIERILNKLGYSTTYIGRREQ